MLLMYIFQLLGQNIEYFIRISFSWLSIFLFEKKLSNKVKIVILTEINAEQKFDPVYGFR